MTIPTISEIKGNTILQLLTNVYNTLKNAILGKQNKLVAGDNIIIDEETNIISAIEGGTPALENYYTKPQTNALLNEKANIEDVYDKTEADNLLSEKENLISAGNNISIITGTDNKKTIKLSDNVNREGTTNLVGNTNITGNVTVTGNITQNGRSYETHAEKIYTKDDYIITREGATGGLGSDDYSGLEVEKYNGVDNCRLVVDNEGVARVGDTGDEQPLMTRDDASNLINNALLKWDGNNYKAVAEGNVGSDTKPIRIVNGVAQAVLNDLVSTMGNQNIDGVKTFLKNILLSKDENCNCGIVPFYVDESYMGIIIWTGKDKNNCGEIRLCYNSTDGTALAQIGKTVNGVWTFNTPFASI